MRQHVPIRPATWLVGATALLLAPSATAGLFGGKKEPEATPEVEEVEEVPVQPPRTGLFPSVLDGWHPGELPASLPSLSAQACNACHYTAHDTWADSAHAGPGSDAWGAAVTDVGTPACASCHQPLQAQRPERFSFDAGDVNAVLTSPNEHFDAGLHLEGVTCAACHVRDGTVVAARPVAAPPTAHPAMGWSEDLTSSTSCAACHQLTWPGADRPLYDTFGEWDRSGYAEAGVGCVDCHLGPGASEGPVSHALVADLRRALTIGIDTDALALSRGGEALEVAVSLTNTGAGHAVPTGSPWRVLQVELLLEGPAGEDGARLEVARTDTPLGRTLSESAPWTTTEDTRLQVGERRELTWKGALDTEHPAGDWAFTVRLRPVIRGAPAAEPALVKRLPLAVD